jgi:hypothetical protein
MQKTAIAFLFLLFAPAILGGLVDVQIQRVSEAPVEPVPQSPLDLCNFCFTFMEQAINQLLNIVLNVGVIGSCGDLCNLLPNQLEAVACDLLCDYVGIEGFIDAINAEDPDPIFTCEEIDCCKTVDNGNCTIVSAGVTPQKGPAGTTFNIYMKYQVSNPTGPGYLAVGINAPDGVGLGDDVFEEGQAGGMYQVTWPLDSTPSEQEAFGPGVYQVFVAVCEGDCTGDHKWSGVYANATTSFTITSN